MRQTLLDEFLNTCPWCGRVFRNRGGLGNHIMACSHLPTVMRSERERERLERVERVRNIEAMRDEVISELSKEPEQEKRQIYYIG